MLAAMIWRSRCLTWIIVVSTMALLVVGVGAEPKNVVARAPVTSHVVTAAGLPCVPTGDVNGDTVLTPADVVAVLQHYFRRQLLSMCDQEQGDVFMPGSGLTPRDAQCLVQAFLALPSCFDGDQDGLPDTLEVMLGLDPNDADTDDDGILDGDEDLDQDGLTNIQELIIGHNPGLADSDSDGVLDGAEDSDDDGLPDAEEFLHSTRPLEADTDRDGWIDGIEVASTSDPLDAASQPPLLIAAPGLVKVGVLDSTTTVAVPPVTVAILAPGDRGDLPAGVTVAQPPITVRIQPSGP